VAVGCKQQRRCHPHQRLRLHRLAHT
jgi:hypothetical protein